jgi:hypothetical protein
MLTIVKILWINTVLFVNDIFELIRDNIQLLRGLHKVVLSDKAGGLTEGASHARVAIVAMYAEDVSIPFVKNLLQALAAADFFILTVSTRRLSQRMTEEILPLCHRLIERSPVGRDFGSYQTGLQWVESRPSLKSADTLALANDSLFYPPSISDILQDLLQQRGDWLALFENFQYHYHAQSFFQIFRAPVFRSSPFVGFWRNYRPLSSRKHSINKGEVGFSLALRRAGFLPIVRYTSNRIIEEFRRALGASDDHVPLRQVLYANLGPTYEGIIAGRKGPTAASVPGKQPRNDASQQFDRERDPLVEPEVISAIIRHLSERIERHNPTHSIGLLANFLCRAPIKRDVCYRGIFTMGQVLDLATGYSASELAAMESDMRWRGTPAMFTGLKRILYDRGRI